MIPVNVYVHQIKLTTPGVQDHYNPGDPLLLSSRHNGTGYPLSVQSKHVMQVTYIQFRFLLLPYRAEPL